MNAQALFRDGRLREAFAVQQQYVLERTEDAAGRLFLVELHLYLGQFDDARQQLSHFREDSPALRDFVTAYHDLLNAEEERQSNRQGSEPTFLGPLPKHLKSHVEGLRAYREGKVERCLRLLDASSQHAAELTGHIDGREFEEVRNPDDFLSCLLEVFVGSNYAWVPFESIRKLRLAEIDSPRDHLFRPGLLTLRDDRVVEVFVPTVYAGTWKNPDDEFLLGRATDWVSDADGLVRGVGAQTLWFGDEELTLHDFRVLEIRNPDG
jgi:protein involved in temperature-dependent protein secretion